MVSITEFLEARIAEDEDAERRKWRYADKKIEAEFGPCSVEYRDAGRVIIRRYDSSLPSAVDAEEFRVTYGEPAPDKRMLAECAAKRAILEHYTGSPATFQIVAHMAAIYSDHPDYQQEWAV